MIQITEKHNCCGCTSCYSVCPNKCISMETDSEGFIYPKVNKEKCIACNICEKICPMTDINTQEKVTNTSLYLAAQNNDKKVLKHSTSGGVFSLIANYVIKRNGVVIGVGYDNEMKVCHSVAENMEHVSKFRGSKYVQSDMNDIFVLIQRYLKNGRLVFYTGTPCQVSAIKGYFGNDSNLLTMDILCLGVSSPGLYKQWVDFLEHKYKDKIEDIEFRNKNFGYSVGNVKVLFKNGKVLQQAYDSKAYAKTFFSYYNVRPSCYQCKFRGRPRESDFTLGDLIDVDGSSALDNDDLGASRLWVHTDFGVKVLKDILPYMKYQIIKENIINVIEEADLEIKMPAERKNFFDDVNNLEYKEWISKWIPNDIRGQAISLIRRIINLMPFRKIIFKKMRLLQAKKFDKETIKNEKG